MLDAAYASDRWRAADLGFEAHRGRDRVGFTSLRQDWLHDAAKQCCRSRLSMGAAFSSVAAMAQGLTRFLWFLHDCHPEVDGLRWVTRPLLEQFLAWLAASRWAPGTRAGTLVMVRGFLDWVAKCVSTIPGLRRSATIYACPTCDHRALGEQRCEDCNTFLTRQGIGGLCPCCEEPITIDELTANG